MIAVVDYGMANLRSVEKALVRAGGDAQVTSDPGVVASADKVVLPGVGAFCASIINLNRSGLREVVLAAITSGKPFLGICVGLQMLFDTSSEMGITPGLGVLPGEVIRFFEYVPAQQQDVKIPHIGWNSLRLTRPSRLMRGVTDGERVYFVHSYHPDPRDAGITAATSDYGYEFCCAIETDNVMATQFHPEKSGAVGIQILRNFVAQ